MKHVDEEGNAISGYYDLNKEIRENRNERICMNPECLDLKILDGLKPNRPLISLGKRCWNCKNDEYLKEYNGSN